ncbi:MAG: winged helix-turn-helix domain-containing protein [Candidatus Bathyarchaeia archaeon]
MRTRLLHPKAYLPNRRNMERGLISRTKILESIEVKAGCISEISESTGLSYASVTYHLRMLRAEGIVEPIGKRPFLWKLTSLGQQKLL